MSAIFEPMTAGHGIVHSERTPPELRTGGGRLFGIRTSCRGRPPGNANKRLTIS